MIDAPLELLRGLPSPAPVPATLRTGESFAAVLSQAAGDWAAGREAASQLVSSAFILPVLAALRESQFLEPPFAPTFAERRFQPLLDQQIADRITSAANFPLVDAIVDRYLGDAP